MKIIPIEIPEGKKAEWVNSVLTLVDDKPLTTVEGSKAEFKFKVGDKVKRINDSAITYTITGQFVVNGEPMYNLKVEWGETTSAEKWLELAPQDITERIKTFEDAVKWCDKNKPQLVDQWQDYLNKEDDDVEAYLKLRIISAALNEGWEPTDNSQIVYMPKLVNNDGGFWTGTVIGRFGSLSLNLCFKSSILAEYAAHQFRDIYVDYCGCKKGGDK